jgi:hypothetical protein
MIVGNLEKKIMDGQTCYRRINLFGILDSTSFIDLVSSPAPHTDINVL